MTTLDSNEDRLFATPPFSEADRLRQQGPQVMSPQPTIDRERVRLAWKRAADKHAFAYNPEYLSEAYVDALIEFVQSCGATSLDGNEDRLLLTSRIIALEYFRTHPGESTCPHKQEDFTVEERRLSLDAFSRKQGWMK